MATVENVSVKFSARFAGGDDDDVTKRLMVVITCRERDELSQTDAAARYGSSSSWENGSLDSNGDSHAVSLHSAGATAD
jgi:hypothetical protein